MINLNEIERYRENNRIEAKKALGGLPESIWETYSAFANTLGGIILLGVEEYRDHSLHTVDLPHPEEMVNLFFDKVNDERKVSANILSRNDVFIVESGGNHIICINVPRASRRDRPVYINGHIEESYRRSGEGDYRCTKGEIESMLRDREKVTRDMRVVDVTADAIDDSSWKQYRRLLSYEKKEDDYETMPDEALLEALHAGKKEKDGFLLTRAGLLMFGKEEEILRQYAQYSLVCDGEEIHGNLFSFFIAIKEKIRQLSLESDLRHGVVEALRNCIVNADYEAGGPLTITFSNREIEMENPGTLRIAFEQAVYGGYADPRNSAVSYMFNLIGEGNHNGSGIPGIWSTWRKHGQKDPVIEQQFQKERTRLILPLYKAQPEKVKETRMIMRAQEAFIIQYLTDNISATKEELCDVMHVEKEVGEKLLGHLMAEGVIIHDDSLNPLYKLKA